MTNRARDIVVSVVENGWTIEGYGSLHVSHVFTSAKRLKTFLTQWVDETRFDHGMRMQNGDQTAPTGEDGSEIPVWEPQRGGEPETA